MSGELEKLEWRDALTEGGESELNSHYVVPDYYVFAADWPKQRQYIMEKLDYELGVHIVSALKRGWRAIRWERWTWHDDDMRPRPRQWSATEILDWLDRPPSIEMEPPPIPDWLKREIYGPQMRLENLYHIRTRITVDRPKE